MALLSCTSSPQYRFDMGLPGSLVSHLQAVLAPACSSHQAEAF